MKTTLIATFAFALMAFAFNTNPAMAGDQSKPWASASVDELNDPDETEVATRGGQPSVRSPSRGNNDSVQELLRNFAFFGQDYCNENPDDHICNDTWNSEAIESELALGGCVTDWSSGRTVCCYPSSSGRGVACHYPNEEGAESEVAGLTRRQKQQQDEDDWNAWILGQYAGYMDYCARSGNCMMNDPDSESLDGFGGRDIADSGAEGSTSAAGADR
ncbi:MAG: hypothetical protein OXF09_00555 [Hyphomicrobiales bacterium]|nr:hypothetical protein [Hyphomicrobiales bacterium]